MKGTHIYMPKGGIKVFKTKIGTKLRTADGEKTYRYTEIENKAGRWSMSPNHPYWVAHRGRYHDVYL